MLAFRPNIRHYSLVRRCKCAAVYDLRILQLSQSKRIRIITRIRRLCCSNLARIRQQRRIHSKVLGSIAGRTEEKRITRLRWHAIISECDR